MKLRLFATFIALLIAVSGSLAQKKETDAHLTGHVIDLETNEHIPYATVSIKGTTIGGITDATGHFLLKNLPLGRLTVVTTVIGYQSLEKEVVIEAHKTIELKFELNPQILQMDEVVVSSSRNETKKQIQRGFQMVR
ncbi:carboxypeptidase-like regulatory domain-containing protein [Bacteroidales bacterium OttesenSCG-928-I14]|nr:carboxypeptidase-like regulatory domain-containing protein [Bacteroidales bacterium OttesenSCG-928-I14]